MHFICTRRRTNVFGFYVQIYCNSWLCGHLFFKNWSHNSERKTLGQHMHCHIFFKPTLDFSFSIWCSTSSVSSVFSRRSYATLLVPFIRFRGSTDIPYAWKIEQIHHYNQTTHMACASTPTHKSTSLLSKTTAAHNNKRTKTHPLRGLHSS